VPPVICSLTVLLAHATTAWLAGDASIGDGGGVGGVAVPTVLFRLAVVCRPTESLIVNTSGLTQVPLVIAENGIPAASTVELISVTAPGNVEATV
jgi:hypothetical protein